MKAHIKILFTFALSLLMLTALAGCGQENENTPTSGISVTVEASEVYEITCEASANTESTLNADSSAMKGVYHLDSLPPCQLTAYDADHKELATIDLSQEQADTLVELTLTENMEFVRTEP